MVGILLGFQEEEDMEIGKPVEPPRWQGSVVRGGGTGRWPVWTPGSGNDHQAKVFPQLLQKDEGQHGVRDETDAGRNQALQCDWTVSSSRNRPLKCNWVSYQVPPALAVKYKTIVKS